MLREVRDDRWADLGLSTRNAPSSSSPPLSHAGRRPSATAASHTPPSSGHLTSGA